MPGQLPQTKRVEMFEAYCDRRSVQHVARVCSVSPTTALRYKRLDGWDQRLKGITRKAEEKIDDSIAEMRVRQAKQARAVQAKALQKIVADGFKTSRAAADAYFKAAQEERVTRGEPSDRFNLVQEQMVATNERYEWLKRVLHNRELRELLNQVFEKEPWLESGEG